MFLRDILVTKICWNSRAHHYCSWTEVCCQSDWGLQSMNVEQHHCQESGNSRWCKMKMTQVGSITSTNWYCLCAQLLIFRERAQLCDLGLGTKILMHWPAFSTDCFRGIAAKCMLDGACTPGQLTCWQGLGAVHWCHNQLAEQELVWSCLHVMGILRTKERSLHWQGKCYKNCHGVRIAQTIWGSSKRWRPVPSPKIPNKMNRLLIKSLLYMLLIWICGISHLHLSHWLAVSLHWTLQANFS